MLRTLVNALYQSARICTIAAHIFDVAVWLDAHCEILGMSL